MLPEVKVSLISFLSPLSLFGLPLLKFNGYQNSTYVYCIILVAMHVCLTYFLYKNFQIFIRAYGIGFLFVLGLCIAVFASPVWFALGMYFCVVAFFHISEYLATALFSPSTLDLKSFLINHSFAYNVAHLTCCLEYALWCWMFPGLKLFFYVQLVGLALCIFGELLRKGAMYTAGVNFTHLIQYHRRQEHVLVTSGIYSICRHPSYVGWFYWSISTQILLCNPICFIGFAAVSWKFFEERIYEEEQTLINFFETDYMEYQQKVPTGIPFIRGYRLHRHTS